TLDTTGLVTTDITEIVFVYEYSRLEASGLLAGNVNCEVGSGLTNCPDIPGTAYVQADLVDLPANSTVTSDPSHATVMTGVVTPGTDLDMSYNVSADGQWAFSSIVLSSPLDLATAPGGVLTIALDGVLGTIIKVEVKDGSGNTRIQTVTLQGAQRNYTLDTTGLVTTDITEIVFVYEYSRLEASGLLAGNVNCEVGSGLSNLTSAQEVIRQQIVEDNLDYLSVGIDPETHLPVDKITTDGLAADYTQLTAIGFHLQVLGDIINGDVTYWGMTQAQAISEARAVLDTLSTIESTYGWGGLLPAWLDLDASGAHPADNYTYAFIDNANLAQSLACLIGALESGTFDASVQGDIDSIIADAELFINGMGTGFGSLYQEGVNQGLNIFSASYDPDPVSYVGWIDRFSFESRSAVAFVVTEYGISADAWNKLSLYPGTYTDSDGDTIETLMPYFGGAFEMFWSLLKTNEMDYAEMSTVLRNFLYCEADFANQNILPGFPSPCELPAGIHPDCGIYYPGVGITGLSEAYFNVPENVQLVCDLGSIYGLASAYQVDPSFVIAWLNKIQADIPSVRSEYGWVDSLRSGSEEADNFLYYIDQASIILGLTNTGGDYFNVYLENRAEKAALDSLYTSLSLAITPTTKALPSPPDFAESSLSVLFHYSDEGVFGGFPDDETTDVTGLDVDYTGCAARGGHYWELESVHDARGETMLVTITPGTVSPVQVIFELVNSSDVLIGTYTFDVAAGSAPQTLSFAIPDLPAFADVAKINMVVDPTATFVNAADFYIDRITFLHFSSIPDVMPDPGLDADDVDMLPGNPVVAVGGDDATKQSFVQTSLSHVDFTYDVTAGNFSYLQFLWENWATPNHETADLSGLNPLVFGVSGPNGSKLKVEVVDVNDVRAIFELQDITGTVQYYPLDFNNIKLPGTFDPTQVSYINFVVDQALAGTNPTGVFNIDTGGLSFTPVIAGTATGTPSSFPNVISPSGNGWNGGTSVVTVIDLIHNTEFKWDYNVSAQADSGAYAELSFDDGGTPAIEYGDLSGRTELVLGLQGLAGSRVKVEIVDANGLRAAYICDNLEATTKYYTLSLNTAISLPSGFLLDQVAYINLVIDQSLAGAGNYNGSIEIYTDGVSYVATVPGAGSGTVTPMPDSPDLTGGSGNGGDYTLNQISASEFTLDYDVLAQSSSYSFARLTWDDPTTPAVTETVNLSAYGSITLGASGPDGADVLVQFVDINGRIAERRLLDLVSGTEQYYGMPFSSAFYFPWDFDKTQVAYINIIVTRGLVESGNETGTIHVWTNGLEP
ncbi:MAG: hypothetical protein PHE61_05710, partial [Candidatus Omnitrophica bacterium]|nr:hypothetical protein [Candidatus Omnitrophota bacterium]